MKIHISKQQLLQLRMDGRTHVIHAMKSIVLEEIGETGLFVITDEPLPGTITGETRLRTHSDVDRFFIPFL